MTRYGKDFAWCTRAKGFAKPLVWERQLVAGTYTGAHHGGTLLCFTCSWSDFFLPGADAWRPDAWQIIRETPHITYQILSKRPERLVACLPDDWGCGYPNVWLGVSVENARWLGRLTLLDAVPAVVHFASFEPLLGAVGDLAPYLPLLQWAIIGGESGPKRRPMALAWMTQVADQCQAAGIPTWVKQDSALRDGQQGRIPDALWALKQLPAAVGDKEEHHATTCP
jgi:protein gp37